ARAAVPGHHPPRQGRDRHARRRLQRQRRVRDGQGRRRPGAARRARDRARGADRHPPRGRRHRDHLPRQGRRPVAQQIKKEGPHPTDGARVGASGGRAPLAKVRSRRDGSAVPLDETDKKLLNLMQGSFALTERPFAHVAELAGIPEADVMTRVQRLLDKRIIRELTPIFDTRALGYSSMLVAAKVDAANPHRAAQFINSHPGVTHNYLRNHEFNLWFTLAVEPDSKLVVDTTLDVMAARMGAESIRQLPTLKLFKIRMDLEMEGGTDALKTPGEAVEPLELDPIELSPADV